MRDRRAPKALPNSQGLSPADLTPEGPCCRSLDNIIPSGARIPPCVPEGLCSSCQLCFSHTSQGCCSRDGRVGRRKEGRGSREGEEAGGLFCKGIPWTGEPLPCRMGPGCDLEHNQLLRAQGSTSAAPSSCKGLITHKNQARIIPYKNKYIQKRCTSRFSSTLVFLYTAADLGRQNSTAHLQIPHHFGWHGTLPFTWTLRLSVCKFLAQCPLLLPLHLPDRG